MLLFIFFLFFSFFLGLGLKFTIVAERELIREGGKERNRKRDRDRGAQRDREREEEVVSEEYRQD